MSAPYLLIIYFEYTRGSFYNLYLTKESYFKFSLSSKIERIIHLAIEQ